MPLPFISTGTIISRDVIERTGLFVPLDNRRQWYRYHHLFADLLRGRLHAMSGPLALAEEASVEVHSFTCVPDMVSEA